MGGTPQWRVLYKIPMKIIPAVAVTVAICGLAMFTAVRPATARTGLAAVACVGTGPAAEAGANRVAEVHPANREVAYRIGVPLDDREAVARSLRAQLDGYAEVLCAWSGPGDSHLVIIGYTRESRQDPTLRARGGEFEAFAVGYGSNWGVAELNAKRFDDRLGAEYDGADYEVLVRETWAADDAGLGQAVTEFEPGHMFQECETCPVMVVLPARSFRMGSRMGEWDRQGNEMTARKVKIGAPFAVGVYEVTFEEWDACVRGGGCAGYSPDDEGWGRGKRPVVNVSQRDARRYVRWLSERTGADYRLLTEAEWEYAARGGTLTARHWGEGELAQCRYANGWGKVAQCADGYDHSAPVGSYAPNDFGLYDVLGNVWEWTENCWRRNYGGLSEGERYRLHSGNHLGFVPTGMLRDCSRGVLRGGSWHSDFETIRSASRNSLWGGIRLDYNGFRVARSIS